ncbi:MAG: shikimate dehydrogenase [Fimbriimonadaceae bacterium]
MTVYPWREAPPAEFAVIGDPIAHSRSPVMQTAGLRSVGRQDRYVAVHVPRGEVHQALDHLADRGYRGVNVTVPHKEAALAWADSADGFTRRIGAANTIDLAKRSATNTDAPGFLDTLKRLEVAPPGPVLILGAGGSARALAPALAEAGFDLLLWNRTRSKAESIRDELAPRAKILSQPDPAGCALVVNATSASLQGDENLEIDWPSTRAFLPPIAYDLVYGAIPTAFLNSARAAGWRTVDGRHMLVAQGARSLSWWIGVEPDQAAMLAALEDSLR